MLIGKNYKIDIIFSRDNLGTDVYEDKENSFSILIVGEIYTNNKYYDENREKSLQLKAEAVSEFYIKYSDKNSDCQC